MKKTDRDPIEELAESFLERFRRGERPSIGEYVEKHPELAERIELLFPTLVMMEDLGSVDDGAQSGGSAVRALDEQRPQRLGDYRILGEVGRGGMGIVYEAEQESLGRHVALKVLPLHGLMDSNHLKRFQREARAAAKLHHSNIVPVFDVGEHEGVHYYAMQFIHGQGLDEVYSELVAMSDGPAAPGTSPDIDRASIDRASSDRANDSSSAMLPGQPDLSATSVTNHHYAFSVARIGAQAADALAYAHEQGILHRDVKPSNLMLDTEGTVWVADFGLAKTDAKEDLTHTGDLVGTLRYMAPERFEGWSDARSDVYGLGLSLYEMLILQPAYQEFDRAKLIKRITTEELARPRHYNPRIPLDLETIVLKSIAREPRERYQSAAQLAADLRRFISGQPIEARRTSLTERVRMWCQRNPLVASLVAALVLFMVVGIVAVSWAALHFEQVARDRQGSLTAQKALVRELTDAKRIATKRLYGSGRFQFEQKEYEQAIRDFTALLNVDSGETDPDKADYYWWRGHANGQLHRINEAVADLSRFVELTPESALGYAARASWNARGGAYRLAIDDYRKAISLDPGDATFFNDLAWCEAMSPSNQRDLDHALDCARKAVNATPRKWSFNITLGIVHYKRGEYDRAIRVLEKTRQRVDSHACCFLAMCYQQTGDLKRAMHFYRSAADAWGIAGGRSSRLRIHEWRLYAAEADALMDSYLERHPDHFDLLFTRTIFRFRMNKPTSMVEDATRMIELRPELNDGYFWRGRAHMSLRQDELAIQDFQKSLSIKPVDYWPSRNLAWLYAEGPREVRDLAQAEKWARKSGRLKPQDDLWKEVLGLIQFRQGRFNDAVQILHRVSEPERYGAVQSVLAMCYHQLGRPTEAKNHFDQIDTAWRPMSSLDGFWASIRRSLHAEAKALLAEGE